MSISDHKCTRHEKPENSWFFSNHLTLFLSMKRDRTIKLIEHRGYWTYQLSRSGYNFQFNSSWNIEVNQTDQARWLQGPLVRAKWVRCSREWPQLARNLALLIYICTCSLYMDKCATICPVRFMSVSVLIYTLSGRFFHILTLWMRSF